MAERRLRLKLGIFIAGTLIVLACLVIFFGRAPDLFSQKATYTVIFPEAPGIGPGTPIRKSGVRIGEVNDLDLDPETGQVRIHIRVERKYLPRKNEEATITKGLLSGDAAIDFLPRLPEEGGPSPPGEVYPPGSQIAGVPPITPRSLLTPASGVLANAQQSLDRIVKAFEKLERLERLGPKVESALEEITGLARDARGFLPELKKTNDKFQNLLGNDVPNIKGEFIAVQNQPEPANLKGLIKDIQELVRAVRPVADDVRATIRRLEPELTNTVKSARQTFDGVNEILSPENRKQFTELLKNINGVAVYIIKISNALSGLLDAAEKTLRNFDTQVTGIGALVTDVRTITKPLAARSDAIAMSVIDTAEQLSKTLAEVRSLLQSFGHGNGSIQKLLTDPMVYQNLDDAAGSLARILARAEKISRDLEVFSDKIARRPELIGIGGALRPSSGLKEAPGASLPAYRPDWPPAVNARESSTQMWLLPPTAPEPVQPSPNSVQGYPPR
ncbi:MAG TPA: MlaD family protein [Gemmata sp.]|nr:MlaD family protein [Gemmata sp.]